MACCELLHRAVVDGEREMSHFFHHHREALYDSVRGCGQDFCYSLHFYTISPALWPPSPSTSSSSSSSVGAPSRSPPSLPSRSSLPDYSVLRRFSFFYCCVL